MSAAQPIRLSICIPTYNFGEFIGDTLESILPQLVDGVEVAILDGGSTDRTPEVVRGFQERYPGLVYERRPERGGIDRDLARTVDLGRGDYCWLFCADDLMKPGAVAAMLEHISTGRDLYVCGFTLATRAMAPIYDQPVVALDVDTDFDLGREDDRRRYFSLARTTTAFFSFAGSLIVRRACWDSRQLDEEFVGSCWAHVARLFSIIADDGLTIGYLATPYLFKRTENDSFMDSGIVRRYALAIDGYHRLAATFFPPDGPEARDIRRVVVNEFPPWILLHAKAEATRDRPEDLALLDGLAAKAYCDPTPANRVRHLIYRSTPIPAYLGARRSFQILKAARAARAAG
jgi:abequosyltransferase